MHPQRNLITEAQNIVSEGSRGFKGEETKKDTSPEDMAELIRKGIEAALKKRRAGKNDDTDSPHYKITADEDHEEARRALRMD